jgi:hypothetical protein
MSLEMAHKVILPPKKNYIPQFLKQRDINSYNDLAAVIFTSGHVCRELILASILIRCLHGKQSKDK